jgi:site-specific DNA recombinase
MKKAVIFARVSTPEQQKQGLSLDEIQLPKMRTYAEENGLIIEREYVFQETASDKLRKQFDEMVRDVKKATDIFAVVAFRVDRLTRNFRDAVAMDELRKKYGKELHLVDDRLVIKQDTYGKEIGDWDTKVYLAKQHINRCQEDAYNTLYSKLEAGESYGKAPYGYKNDEAESGKKIVVVEPYEAGIVKKVFDLYTSGAYSYGQIAKKLNKENGTKLYKRKIEHILTNKYYIGIRVFKGKEYQHKFERIIDEDVFEIAEQIREGRVRTKKKGKLMGKTGLYRGLIYCAECGCSFSPSPNRHKKLGREVQSESYYYCTNAKGKHRKKPKGTNDKELTELFAGLFEKIKVPDEELERLTETLRESHESKARFNESEVDECNRQIKRYLKMIGNAYEDKCSGSITQDEYDEYQKKWRAEINKHQSRLDKILKADEEYYITASYLLELASRSQELFEGSEPEQKRQIITLTLQNLSIKDGKLCYDWIKPFDSIFMAKQRHTWGGRRDSI